MTGRVLVVTNDFPPRRGGIESFVNSLCAGLPADQVVVYTATMPGSAAYDATLPFRVIRDRSSRLLPSPRVARTVQAVTRRHGCDRAVFGAAAPLGLLAPALRSAGIRRMIGLTHGHEVWWAKAPATRQLLGRIGDSVDVLTYVSEHTRREIASALSAAAVRRMVRLSPGVDLARFNPAVDGAGIREELGIRPRQAVALAAGRLVRRKGFDILLRAWPSVLDTVPDAVLLMVGDGRDERRLRASAATAGVADSVRFRGGVVWNQMPQHYAAADVFALPCRSRLGGLELEALGIVFLEAAASALPVIAGASGGAPETVADGETGYVVNPRDVAELTERLSLILGSPAAAARMGAAGRVRMAEHWPSSRTAETLQKLLD